MIARGIDELKRRGSAAWLEVVYEGDAIGAGLRERLDEATVGTGMEILRVRNSRIMEHALRGTKTEETLDDLDATEVFTRRRPRRSSLVPRRHRGWRG